MLKYKSIIEYFIDNEIIEVLTRVYSEGGTMG